MTKQEFKESIQLLRSKDPMTFEDGFHWLIGHADEYSTQLTILMINESDPSMRAKFVEVLGYCESDEIIDVLASELTSEHQEIRFWAHSQLSNYGGTRAEAIAKEYQINHPEEWY